MKVYHFFLLFLVISSCSTDSTDQVTESSVSTSLDNPTTITILIFQKEKTAEIWMDKPQKRLIQEIDSKEELRQLHLGFIEHIDELPFSLKQSIESNSNYKDATKRVLVFPNDARNSGYFEPCFACPHTVSATYASLEMHLKNY